MSRTALEYLSPTSNTDIPSGVVTSTARKGPKWQGLVKPGDVVDLKYTNGAVFGQATIIQVIKTTYDEVIWNANKNHVAHGALCKAGEKPEVVLANELIAAYGAQDSTDEQYTVVAFIRHN
jgi:hypothetical protein